MAKQLLKKRTEIDNKFKWDIEGIYKTNELCAKDLDKAVSLSKNLLEYQGKICESKETLLKVMLLLDEIEETFEKAFVYVMMKMQKNLHLLSFTVKV